MSDQNSACRVRFAPSPTGPLHIGGVRTALYNYLFARQNKGTFILRIEDTDQTRLVPGAEQYIVDSLMWFGLIPDEGPGFGGNYGPYRQSERKALYKEYVYKLIDEGKAYYAFDTPEELDKYREQDQTFKYDGKIRLQLRNSLSMSAEETQAILESGTEFAIRLKIEPSQIISFEDSIRGQVSFNTDELDDKVILKGDGMPTYHLANIIDDHLMEITHVIRGEEWLSSTAHHVILYNYFGWTPPKFAHLPLILKPSGKGKLSKRDGAKFGFPVFPLSWESGEPEDRFIGFREDGYVHEAVINFLALLGWSPHSEQEMFSLNELIAAFHIDNIVKSGARFDIDKALWFNQHYIIQSANAELAKKLQPISEKYGYTKDLNFLAGVAGLMKERVHKIDEMITNARYFFEAPDNYDNAVIKKKFRPELADPLRLISDIIIKSADVGTLESNVKTFISETNLKLGDIMPLIRLAVSGTMQGPDLFQTIALVGLDESAHRIENSIEAFEKICSA
ncbi:MAG: glutamate--tRNA ligase [Saprospiraceae bacterium]